MSDETKKSDVVPAVVGAEVVALAQAIEDREQAGEKPTPNPNGYDVSVEVGAIKGPLFVAAAVRLKCRCCEHEHLLNGLEAGHKQALLCIVGGGQAHITCHLCGAVHRVSKALVAKPSLAPGALNRHARRAMGNAGGGDQ